MFAQVFQGRTSDGSALMGAVDRWTRELGPTAVGWLGSTSGVTDDGTFIGVARFESAEAARRNSDRPEQGEWWTETEKLFDGEVTFHDSEDVEVDLQGDPDRAGFVQVMQGRTKDPARGRELMTEDEVDWATFRPDILGTLMVNHEADGWTMAIYFTSEADARDGEKKEPPAELQESMAELNELAIGETTYYDLTDPWLMSP